jgi:acyl transferase domain-containing protein/NADPH:quinone reductase-like Zn-dependent oxidoreductase/NAD(P)-dependent dehydrogenase (short-subunit alcohol dehydrogenase family)/acyl carrier protein
MSDQVKGQGATLERQALAALRKMRQKLDEIEQARTEPIAIVGIGCRLPGGANDPEAFWELLRNGLDAIREVPDDRWKIEDYFDPNPGTPGKTYSRWGGFMDHIDRFDSEFFGISRREAVHMDPQQRVFLEVAWEALENAGIAPDTLKGSSTGVFVGTTMSDYLLEHLRHGKPSDLDAYILSGNTMNGISGRLAYFLGTHGPSISMDTACSSSLVALDRACRSLREGECALAIAGGVNLILNPDLFVCMSRWGMLSPDGRCKTFDTAANGFVRAEGCGIVVLKCLGAALADGDRILALIRGSAVNQDGPSSGLSVPNGLAQEAVIRQALQNARLEPSALSYIEAHGTGTKLGDPIEIDALARVFEPGRNAKAPVILGSVKTNLGHLEAASGITGLVKVVLMLGHKQIPPHLHFTQPSPHISWDKYPFLVSTRLIDWEPVNGKRIAGVSSFGFSGSNAHVILEEAPAATKPSDWIERPLQLLTLSARDEGALRSLTASVEAQLKREPQLSLPDFCFTANVGRSHFNRRLSVLSSTNEEAVGKLRAFLAGESRAGLKTSRISGGKRPKIALLFTGQGAQYVGMGFRLYETSPTFRKVLDQCDTLLRPHLDQPLLSLLYSQTKQVPLLDRTIYTQPAMFALEYSLYAMWSSWGVQPSFVMGHSLGEYVAACAAGVFSLEDGLKLVAQRARLMQAEPAGGRMVSVGAGEEQVRAAIEPFTSTVSIAAINGPRNVVISGATADLDIAIRRLAANGVQAKTLNVSHAFHSPLMEPLLPAFEEAVGDVALHSPTVRLISNLTGRVAKAEEITRPEYWKKHLREPVHFAAGIQTLAESGCDIFLELGPNPVLLAMGKECTPRSDALWLPTLRSRRDNWSECLSSLQAMHHAGVPLNWKGFDSDYPRHRLHLPTYPFQREHFWFESRREAPADRPRHRVSKRPGTHPLLGSALRSPALKETVFQSELGAQDPAFLVDHQICGHVILPAAAYVEMALEGAHHLYGGGMNRVENLFLQDALRLDFTVQTSIQTIFQTKDRDSAAFEIFSAPGDGQEADAVWNRHAIGRVVRVAEPEATDDKAADLQAVRDRCSEGVDTTALYQKLNEHGVQFGPAFRNVHALWRGPRETLAEIVLVDSLHSEATLYRFHPALLDACFQATAQALPEEANTTAEDEVLLPVSIEDVQILRDIPTAFWSHGWLRETPEPAARGFTLDLAIYDPEGQVLGRIGGLHLKRVSRRTLDRALQEAKQNWLFEIQWREAPSPKEITRQHGEPIDRPGTWLILADKKGVGESLRTRLTSAGQSCVLARPGPSFIRQSDDRFALDPVNRMDFERLLEEARITSQTPLRGVLHLWSLDFMDFEAMTSEDLAHSQLLGCGSALHLVQALCSLKSDMPPRVHLVTEGAYAASDSSSPVHAGMTSLCGLGQVIAAEHPELRCRLLDLDRQRTEDGGKIIFEELARGDLGEATIAFRDQSRLVPRLVGLPSIAVTGPCSDKICNPLQLEVSPAGILNDLRWTSVDRAAPGSGEVEIRVLATGLNFRDVLCALGMYPGKSGALGAECAGVVVRVGEGVEGIEPGDKVMAVARGGFSTYVTLRADHVAHQPAGMSLGEAASIPVAFLTTFYGLHRLAHMKAGDQVLIHAGAGGVGLAAIQLAQRVGAKIFATAGSPEKRSHLQGLGVAHVFDSRSLEFADEIMSRTGGRGVDIVLNSLAGEFIAKSASVLAPGGCFLELGKRDILTREQFGAVRPDCKYYAYDLGDEASLDSSLLPGMFKDLLAAFAKGELNPLPATTFTNEQIVDAFRFMAQAKHIGKIVVIKAAPEADLGTLPTKPRLREDATYLVTGGLGGLGLETACWMAGAGARNLVLMGRHAPDTKAKEVLNELIQRGVRIVVEKCDVSDEVELARLFDRMATSMPPLRGIVHAAGLLDDASLERQTWPRFEAVMAPKVRGTWNLHRLTLSSELDFFVLFAAAATLIGSPGQGNYAAANAFMDGLAHHRKAKGLPALSIDWGAWAETGMAARLAKEHAERWTDRGVRPIRLDEGMTKLGEMLFGSHVQIVAFPVDWSKMFDGTDSRGTPSLYSEVSKPLSTGISTDGQARPDRDDFAHRLLAEPAARQLALLKAHVESAASRALGATEAKSLDPRRPLHELGLDSLMSVELRNALATSLGRPLSATLLFDYPTVESLTQYLASNVLKLEFANGVLAEENDASTDKDLEALQAMSETEAESLLLAELNQLKK